MSRRNPKSPLAPGVFEERFNEGKLDGSKWSISTFGAPGTFGGNTSGYSVNNVNLDYGMLQLKLGVTQSGATYTSTGAEVQTIQSFGYGTYEFVVRPSSTAPTPDAAGNFASGNVNNFFNYLNGSTTDINFSLESNPGRENNWTFRTMINDEYAEYDSGSHNVSNPRDGFTNLKWIWEPGRVRHYINGKQVSDFTTTVGSAPAPVIFNLWGTNNANFGGLASPGVDKYSYVSYFRFTPLAGTYVPPAPYNPANKSLGTYWPLYNAPPALTTLPTKYNHVFLFHAEPSDINANGQGVSGNFVLPSTYAAAVPAADVQAVRARGQKVSLTVGGAGAAMYFLNRTQSNNFIASIKNIITSLGGVDGIDFNNYEQFSAPDGYNNAEGRMYTAQEWIAKGHYPASNGTTSTNAWATFNAEMVYIAQQLKAFYGPDFMITSPPAPSQGYAPNDRILIKALNDAGVLTFVQPQYYDSTDLVSPSYIKTNAIDWINNVLSGDPTKYGFILATNYHPPDTWAEGLGSSIQMSKDTWNMFRNDPAYQNIRFMGCWNARLDEKSGYQFANAMYPLVRQ